MKMNSNIDRREFLIKAGLLAFAARTLSPDAFAATAAKPWNPATELALSFSIVSQGFRFRRPYVAVWIENEKGVSVRTLALWVDSRRGYRYIEHLKNWVDDYGNKSDAIVSSVSTSTRDPGDYDLVWDGKDDAGKLLTQGKYFFCLESAREHGPYTSYKEPVTIGATPVKKTLKPDGDIGGISLDYRKRS